MTCDHLASVCFVPVATACSAELMTRTTPPVCLSSCKFPMRIAWCVELGQSRLASSLTIESTYLDYHQPGVDADVPATDRNKCTSLRNPLTENSVKRTAQIRYLTEFFKTWRCLSGRNCLIVGLPLLPFSRSGLTVYGQKLDVCATSGSVKKSGTAWALLSHAVRSVTGWKPDLSHY